MTGPAISVGFFGGGIDDVGPLESETSVGEVTSDACIQVNSQAVPGDEIFVEYNVTADGETRRFMAGPFIVGQLMGNDKVPAVRLNP